MKKKIEIHTQILLAPVYAKPWRKGTPAKTSPIAAQQKNAVLPKKNSVPLRLGRREPPRRRS
jgi:hypothetical protein